MANNAIPLWYDLVLTWHWIQWRNGVASKDHRIDIDWISGQHFRVGSISNRSPPESLLSDDTIYIILRTRNNFPHLVFTGHKWLWELCENWVCYNETVTLICENVRNRQQSSFSPNLTVLRKTNSRFSVCKPIYSSSNTFESWCIENTSDIRSAEVVLGTIKIIIRDSLK